MYELCDNSSFNMQKKGNVHSYIIFLIAHTYILIYCVHIYAYFIYK